MRGLQGNRQYLQQLLQHNDVVCIQEHWLYTAQASELCDIGNQHSLVFKASSNLNDENCGKVLGQGGVAIMYKNTFPNVITIKANSNRICGIKIITENINLCIICVYMPYAQCKISSFRETLDELQNIINDLYSTCQLVILGDYNAHIGPEGGPRGIGKSSNNGVILKEFTQINSLCILDLQSLTSGPKYTYTSHWGSVSYIDHIVVSNDLINYATQCSVYEDDMENHSDHLPIELQLNIQTRIDMNKSKRSMSKIAWDKATTDQITCLYTDPLEIIMYEIAKDIDPCQPSKWCVENPTVIDEVVDFIQSTMKECSNSLPKRQFRKHLKPYWTQELTALSKEEKQARHHWIKEDRPRDSSNPLYISYKEAKCKFRARQRQAEQKYHIEQQAQLKDAYVDQKYFWYLVNKSKKPKYQKAPINPIKDNDGKILTEPNELLIEWETYLEQLASPLDDPEFDDNFKATIEEELNEMTLMSKLNDDKFLSEPISQDEVVTAIKTLKSGKASGWDGVVSEHLHFCGGNTITVLTWLLNCIIMSEYVPVAFRYGIAIPLLKNGKNDRLSKDNYRKITLLPTLCKLFETVTLNRADPWLLEDDRLGSLQGAAVPGCSSLHTTLLLRETIAYQSEGGHDVYIALLDARKAFDSVWIPGLFHKMYNLGIKGKLWRLMKNWYKDIRCKVKIDEQLSSEFRLGQGVFQGGKWSMRLFLIFYRDLLTQLMNSRKGCNIYLTRAVCPTYADDLAIAAPFESTLQDLLDIVHEYACKWRIQFNATKSNIIKVPLCENATELDCHIGGTIIPSKYHVMHLGTQFGKEEDIVTSMLAKGQTCFNAMLGIGSRCGGINPVIGSKMYWSNVIPAMLYGAEVLCLSQSAIDRLEVQHRKFAKRLQRLPEKTANPLAYSTLGWESIQSYIAKQSLQFMQNIYHLHTSSVYKNMFIDRIVDILMHDQESSTSPCSPIKWFIMCCARYGLLDQIRDMLITGVAQPKAQWKSDVKRAVGQHEKFFIRAERLCYKKLGYSSPVSRMDLWWKVAFQYPASLAACRLMVKIKLGEEPLQCNTSRYEDGPRNKLCKLCAMGDEDARHFLFDCVALANSRTEFLANLCILSENSMEIINSSSVDAVVNQECASGRHNFLNLSNVAKSINNMLLERNRILVTLGN